MTGSTEITKPNLKGFLRGSDGSSAIMFAVGLSVVFGAAALAIDYSRALAARQFLASAADAAALAAVSGLPDVDEARRMAMAYVERNLPSAQYGKSLAAQDVEFGTWDTETGQFKPLGGSSSQGGPYGDDDDDDDVISARFASTASYDKSAGSPASDYGTTPNAVRITTRMAESNGNELDMLFAWVVDKDNMDVSASAVAGRGGPPCVLALNPSDSSAMSLSFRARLETIGCGVQVNSKARPAFEVKDNASIVSASTCVGGTSDVVSSVAAEPEPKNHCPGMSDPLAGLEPPSYGGCDHVDESYEDYATLEPGVYCGGLKLGKFFRRADITMAPGLYVIKDGAFSTNGFTTITGTGVTVFLTGADAELSIMPGTTMNLTAPTSGALQGVLIFQDPDFGGTHQWQGWSKGNLRGVVYLPSGKLLSRADNDMTPEGACLVLIADTLELTGFSKLSIDITSAACRATLPGPYGRGIVLLQ